MMTREQLRKAWMNAQESNYNGNTLLVVQGFDIKGYALFGYEKTFVLFIGRYENVHKAVSTAKRRISENLMHRYNGPYYQELKRTMKELNAALLENEDKTE